MRCSRPPRRGCQAPTARPGTWPRCTAAGGGSEDSRSPRPRTPSLPHGRRIGGPRSSSDSGKRQPWRCTSFLFPGAAAALSGGPEGDGLARPSSPVVASPPARGPFACEGASGCAVRGALPCPAVGRRSPGARVSPAPKVCRNSKASAAGPRSGPAAFARAGARRRAHRSRASGPGPRAAGSRSARAQRAESPRWDRRASLTPGGGCCSLSALLGLSQSTWFLTGAGFPGELFSFGAPPAAGGKSTRG